MEFQLRSSSFDQNGPIPRENTGEGSDLSPALEWVGVPEGTVELALVCEDPDAPEEDPWVHWVLYGIPSSVTKLTAGIPPEELLTLPPRARQGKNSWGRIGYGGPLPPRGDDFHRYFFRLYALNEALDLPAGKTKEQLAKAMRGHVLAQDDLVGRYRRELRRVG